MDLGKVFPVSGGLPLPKRAPQRQAYRLVELARWRDHLGVPINLQPKFVRGQRRPGCRWIIAAAEVSADAGAWRSPGRRCGRAGPRSSDISNADTLADLARGVGLDAASTRRPGRVARRHRALRRH